MQINLIAVGSRLDSWIYQGYEEYAKRLSGECVLTLREIPAEKRGKNADIARITHNEGEKMLAAVPKGSMVLALDEKGQQWTTEQLAGQLKNWLQMGQNLALFVGGPDGLSAVCKKRAELSWSLSKLTLPHPLVRLVVAEQLYRAWSILKNHPYHR